MAYRSRSAKEELKEAMAVQSAAKDKPSHGSMFSIHKISKTPIVAFAFALLLIDALLVALIIAYVPYTKIDWDAYMSQVSGFLEGERDYGNLRGDTGPLVYPAGFLYIYSAIQFLTGGEVFPAQILFGILYVLNLGIVLFIYVKTDVLPWWALSLLCISKRVHSIFVLRLFNDCFAMTLLHAAVASFLYQKWHLGLIIFSGAVSIKMNVLLYAPSLLLLMLKAMDIAGVFSALAGAALVQILLGLPFLLAHPIAYISRAFNLGRVFIHFWSVNFKFVPEPVFVSKKFAVSLLITHLILLAVFAHYRWCKHEGGLLNFLHSRFVPMKLEGVISSSFSLKHFHNRHSNFKFLNKEHIVTTMFVGNFIGILCARSLHYQFYSWYFYSLPYLLWKTSFPTLLRVMLFIVVEFCWNVFPSNTYSSALLLCAHSAMLWGLWTAPPQYPYVDAKTLTKNKKK
ncbi:Dol-P-Man:Man(5)GlcNAc(2)-PP-Dol alpha-1,3-mannosyltransferase [Actinidia chinensis var. chinensis]|uniref:dolichyl-P-Man:Man5GlcNAc2-PP-dolichol alpha-1,3-mannosyltransferase n=1 Tax=Actinidia chinensis var. chinensis TaxID=1590841 RepID=A0A2R6QDM3_ACTCC|nr:Dol-P-Man:Man(5)GlcNAc(2)-PP-Dol alpha-1,3-mannosyltransferase [Actinidia chinensis var. chinensis]